MQRCIGVEWRLEQISDFSLLTNQVIKVIYSYFESPPKIIGHDTTNRCIITSRIVKVLSCSVILFNRREVTCTIYTSRHLFGIFELKSFR